MRVVTRANLFSDVVWDRGGWRPGPRVPSAAVSLTSILAAYHLAKMGLHSTFQ